MILLFPDLDTLKLALAGGIVGPDVTLAPAVFTIDTQGRLYVEPEAELSRSTTKNLDRIGVKGCKRHGSKVQEKIANWLQIVPLFKDPAEPELASQTPVLFELESAEDLPTLVSEMLRLGNDKQSFRWFEADGGARVLLRVLGPPFYTLLRALDRTASGTKGAVRAYLEPTPRVWVEYGFTHPFATQIRVPEEQLLLLRSPRHWLVLEESPFQDVYEILKFDLPQVPVGWNESGAPDKIEVPLKLAAGNAADLPELWVLRDDALDQLDCFVRDADAALTQRLTFAVASDAAGKRVVVLRTRPSKLPPPVLPFENALGFKPFWKLPNLFLPAGKRLHPTLRRDAVRRLLADDPDQVVWLQPDGAGGFKPESVPDAVFRPLENWVDYIIETNQQPLAAWIEAASFDFDSFVCVEPGTPKPKPPDETELKDEFKPVKPTAPLKSASKGKAGPAPKVEFTPAPEPQAPSAWRIRRERLEEQFLGVDGPLDSADRIALWPKLAEANVGEGSQFEAAICWLNAMWSADTACDFADQWFRAEYPTAALDAKEFDRRLAARKPSIEDLRAVVAGFLWLSYQSPLPAWVTKRLPAVQAFFETHESSLPVRAVWLVALRQATLAGSDVLGLARVRDRLLLRLLEEGLRAERDLPTFLRYAGLKDSNRLRVARDKALELHSMVRKWFDNYLANLHKVEHIVDRMQHEKTIIAANYPLVDLLFSFALARLGESTSARQLLDQAKQSLETTRAQSKLDVSQGLQFVAAGFEYRIESAIRGEPHRGPFPDFVLEPVSQLQGRLKSAQPAKDMAATTSSRSKMPGGKRGDLEKSEANVGESPDVNQIKNLLSTLDRLRQDSRVLEPNEIPDPYREVRGPLGEKDRDYSDLARLTDLTDPEQLVFQIRRCYKQSLTHASPKERRCRVLHQAIPLAPRAGENFSLELIKLVPDVLRREGYVVSYPPTPGELSQIRGELIERTVLLAAQYGHVELIRTLIALFIDLISSEPEDTRYEFVKVPFDQCVRTLKRFGMQDLIVALQSRIRTILLPSGSLEDLRPRFGTHANHWTHVLQAISLLGGCMRSLGSQHGMVLLDSVRDELLINWHKAFPKSHDSFFFTMAARYYIRALGHCPVDIGFERIKAFFEHVQAERISSNWTGKAIYSRQHFWLIEEVVHAVTSDEFALGPAGRRWLDEDEYLVRNRIHADFKQLRATTGL